MPFTDVLRRDEPATGQLVVPSGGGRRLGICWIASLLTSPDGHASSPAESTAGWIEALVSRDGPEFEAFRLLSDAWRSPVAAAVHTGLHFDLVGVPEDLAAAAWHRLRLLEVPCGAVFATQGQWHFFVPTRSSNLPWPEAVSYLTDGRVRIPPRSARDNTHGLWWVSRPPSGPFADSISLAAALNAINSSHPGTCPAVAAPTASRPSDLLSPPARSCGV